ncbi:MAG: 30S ribosome-binding factor RbfA [Planctomycetia bacterium]|nr:30S ribosome-binding factor RbfA [Planctomycetia bacterium]
MATRRTLKAAEAIREVVAMALLTDIKDPRVANVTVTRVEVSGDMRTAKVYVTVRGGDAKEALALRGLTSACGFLQQKCAARIDTRYTPRLQFLVDEGMKNLVAVSQILADEKNAREGEDGESGDSATTDDSLMNTTND